MLHWIDCDINYLCPYDSSSCCIGLIVTLFICVLMTLPHLAFDWLRHCLSVFSWFFLMLPWIDCGIVICVIMVFTHVALDWLRQTISVFSWFYLMWPWIDCDIVYLCSHGSSSCCLGLIVTLIICVLMTLPYVVLDWVWHCLSVFSWFFLMLPWIDCGIVICVIMVLTHVALDWLRHCLSVFSWIYLTLPWVDCDIIYLCSHGSSSCCLGLSVALFICVLMVLPYVALDWLWHCLSVFSWFFFMLHWFVTLFISVLMVLPHVALDWLWHCLSVFSWFFLILPWIDCDIVYQYSHGSTSCCLRSIATLFICVLTVLTHLALDWLWH